MYRPTPCPSCGAADTNMGLCSSCGGYVCIFCESRMTSLEAPKHIFDAHEERLMFAIAHNQHEFHFWLQQNAANCAKCGHTLYDYGMCLHCNKFTAADRERNPPVVAVNKPLLDEDIPFP